MSGRVKVIISLIITIFCTDYVKSQCATQNPCLCIGQDGWAYDLSAAEKHGILTATLHNDTVKFQPCKNTDLSPESKDGKCKSTSLCLIAKNTTTTYVNIGQVEETHWQWPSHKNPLLVFKHDPYISQIEILCATHEEEPVFRFAKKDGNNLFFDLSWNKLCSVDMTPKGLSTGSILLILFFTFAGIYFIGGSAALIISRGAVGRETIPHYEFWADLPALVRDGVTFTLSGCSIVSYEQI